MENRKLYALAVQETGLLPGWTGGVHSKHLRWKSKTFTIIRNTETVQQGPRGIAIILNSEATKAWKAGGEVIRVIGERTLAISSEHELRPTWLVTAHAPTDAKRNTSAGEQNANVFWKDLRTLLAEIPKRKSQTLPRQEGIHERDVTGPWGRPTHARTGEHANWDDLIDTARQYELTVVNTHFRHSRYATWRPRTQLPNVADRFHTLATRRYQRDPAMPNDTCPEMAIRPLASDNDFQSQTPSARISDTELW